MDNISCFNCGGPHFESNCDRSCTACPISDHARAACPLLRVAPRRDNNFRGVVGRSISNRGRSHGGYRAPFSDRGSSPGGRGNDLGSRSGSLGDFSGPHGGRGRSPGSFGSSPRGRGENARGGARGYPSRGNTPGPGLNQLGRASYAAPPEQDNSGRGLQPRVTGNSFFSAPAISSTARRGSLQSNFSNPSRGRGSHGQSASPLRGLGCEHQASWDDFEKNLDAERDRFPCIWCGDIYHCLLDCPGLPTNWQAPLRFQVVQGGYEDQAVSFITALQTQHRPDEDAPFLTSQRRPFSSRTANPNPGRGRGRGRGNADSGPTRGRGGSKGSFTSDHRGADHQSGNDQEDQPEMPLTQTAFNQWAPPHYENDQSNTEMHYPHERSVTTTDTVSTSPGKIWSLPDDISERVLARKSDNDIEEPKHPLRTNYDNVSGGTQILTNHFEYGISATKLWEYKLVGITETRKQRIKGVFEKAIAQWPFLHDHQDKFATNYFDTIIAWEDLHQHISEPQVEREGHTLDMWGLTLGEGDETRTLYFKLANTIDISRLSGYTRSEAACEEVDFDHVARCMNIIVSKSFDKTKVFQQSANKFFVKDARSALTYPKPHFNNPVAVQSHSLEIIRGYFYTVKPGSGNIILNFGLATSAFFRPILVSEFLADTQTFADQKTRLEILGTLRVYITTNRKQIDGEDHERLNGGEARIKKVIGLSEVVIDKLKFRKRIKGPDGKFSRNDNGTFKKEVEETLVSRYLNNTFENFQPVLNQRAVNVGTKADPIWYAQEQLRIVPYQAHRRPVPDALSASMVKQAAKVPSHGRAFIENEGLQTLGFTKDQSTDQIMTNLGDDDVPIRLTPTMLQLSCNVLPIPKPSFGRWNKAMQQLWPTENREAGSRWKVPTGTHFFRPNPRPLTYRFVVQSGFRYDHADRYVETIQAQLRDKCRLYALEALARVEIGDPLDSSVDKALAQAKKDGAELVIFMLERPSVPLYAHLKDLADRYHGIHSLCVVEKHGLLDQAKERLFQEYITNVVMKVNLKMGGITQSVRSVSDYLERNQMMVLGADVVHAGPSAFVGTPSIAAIVGSVDFTAGKCLGSMRLQNIDKADRETIDYVEDMVYERLQAWMKEQANGKLPLNIIYYRDGVGTGQYDTIKRVEVTAIRNAYSKLARENSLPETVNIHAVVVVKRHHTRFYPLKESEGDKYGNGNTHPGTCVDRLVTSPYYQDFYLQSHSGIKGTVKPTHYFVLEDGVPGLTLGNLRDLTHGMCYSYARALCAVSYAPPTYYADRLCDRGRMYMRDYFVKGDKLLEEELQQKEKELRAEKEQLRNALVESDAKIKKKEWKSKKKEQQEKADWKDIKKELAELVFKKVETSFYRFRDQGRMNPWDATLDDSMFWM